MTIQRLKAKQATTTRAGCKPSAVWWKAAWGDARYEAEKVYGVSPDTVGLLGLTLDGSEAHFQMRGRSETIKIAIDGG